MAGNFPERTGFSARFPDFPKELQGGLLGLNLGVIGAINNAIKWYYILAIGVLMNSNW